MFAIFRAFSKSWVAQVFMSLLVVSFAVWGIKDVFHPVLSNAVITAGSHDLQPEDFKRIFENYNRQVAQQGGQPLSGPDAVAQGVDKQMLQSLSADLSLFELYKRMGVRPSDDLVANQLKQQPQFFDPVSGKFDQKAYEGILHQNGMTAPVFEATLKDELARDAVQAGLAAGLKVPLVYGSALSSYEFEGRNLSYFIVTPAAIQIPALPNDQQLQAFMSSHSEALKRPEMRVLTLVRFSTKALAPSQVPNETDIAKMYALRKASLAHPEARSFVQISARDAATAQAIAAKLQAGQDPAAVAKAYGVQPIAYANAPKAAVADPKVAEAAFALASGGVSAPIQTSLAGLAVVKVTAIAPAITPTLEQMRPTLVTELRNEMANQLVSNQVGKYDDSHASGGTLAEAAKAAGVTPVQLGPVSQSGRTGMNQPVPDLSQKLLQTAFSLAPKAESDLVTDGQGEYFAVRVDQVIAPALPSLNEIRGPLTQIWMSDEASKRITAVADALAAKMKKGESLEAAAAEAHSPVGRAQNVTRMQAMQNQQIGQELAAKLFAAKSGDIVTGQTSQLPVMVAHIDAVVPPNVDQAAQFVVAMRDRGSVQYFNDMVAAVRQSALTQVKPTTNPSKARQLLGVSDDAAAKSGAAPANTAP